MSFSFSQIPSITSGKIIQLANDQLITYLITDSRKFSSLEGSLFFAIKGKNHDGHLFLNQLYQNGIRQFIIEKEFSTDQLNQFPEANFFQTTNSVQALQDLAIAHRSQFQFPIIGITGSNAKTIIKEWLAQLLAKDFYVVKNPKSYNSQIGVPLSIWQINEDHQLGIFEAGISQPGEMEKLEKIIQPTWGLFTNIGSAHDEGFSSTEQKIEEKIKLFKKCKTIFYRKDHMKIDRAIQSHFNPSIVDLITWSIENKKTTLFITQLIRSNTSTTIEFIYKKNNYSLVIPFIDDASIENCMHCILILLYQHIEIDDIQQRIFLLKPISMRLEVKEGRNGCYLIDDTYNNDLAGLEIALNFLEQQHQQKTKTVILSDVLEARLDNKKLYKEIAALLISKKIDKLIGIGSSISAIDSFFQGKKEFYTTTNDFLQKINLSNFQQEIILIKGARKFEFEKIIQRFQQKIHGTVLEINLDAIAHNLNFYRSKLLPTTKIMAMVKAFAYGSGSYEIANVLQFQRVDYLAVAYADEGVDLRENGISLPIMVMNPSEDSFEKLITYHLEPEIYNFSLLHSFIQYTQQTNQSSNIHIEIDTGMNRLGFDESAISSLCELLKNNSQLKVQSVFSHLAGSEESTHDSFSKQQIETFQKCANQIESFLSYSFIKHILNSAGIIRFPEAQFDMVRLGIGLYGVEVSKKEEKNISSVSTLKTVISQIKEIKQGDTIGYGRKGIATHPLKIATIAIGYADGYSRAFSNGIGKVWIKGKLASVIGNVCMDMTMIDITDIPAKEGDEVIIFGKEISLTEIANYIHTIPYEILTQLSDRIKRIYYTE